VREHLEGWKADDEELVPELEGEGIEPVVRVRVRACGLRNSSALGRASRAGSSSMGSPVSGKKPRTIFALTTRSV